MLPSSISASPISADHAPFGRSGRGLVRARSPAPARRTASARRRARPSPSRSRRRRRPWCATDRIARRRSRGTLCSLSRRLLAEQILDRVKDRAGVRLDGDAVLRPQHREIERRHDGGERGRRRLVPADLQPVAARRADGWRCGSSRWQATAPCARARCRIASSCVGHGTPLPSRLDRRSGCGGAKVSLSSRAFWRIQPGGRSLS